MGTWRRAIQIVATIALLGLSSTGCGGTSAEEVRTDLLSSQWTYTVQNSNYPPMNFAVSFDTGGTTTVRRTTPPRLGSLLDGTSTWRLAESTLELCFQGCPQGVVTIARNPDGSFSGSGAQSDGSTANWTLRRAVPPNQNTPADSSTTENGSCAAAPSINADAVSEAVGRDASTGTITGPCNYFGDGYKLAIQPNPWPVDYPEYTRHFTDCATQSRPELGAGAFTATCRNGGNTATTTFPQSPTTSVAVVLDAPAGIDSLPTATDTLARRILGAR